jgi:hypothetical protein
MTPGQLIDLLEKAGMLKEESPGVLGWHPTMQKAERFAALVAAAEREACASVCDAYSATENIGEFDRGWISCAKNTAATIRARTKGETNT